MYFKIQYTSLYIVQLQFIYAIYYICLFKYIHKPSNNKQLNTQNIIICKMKFLMSVLDYVDLVKTCITMNQTF